MKAFKELVCACLILMGASLPLMASSGIESHGGDVDEILFHAIASEVVTYATSAEGRALFPETVTVDLKGILNETKVSVVETELYDSLGQRRTAINQPSTNTIYVNRTDWKGIRENAGVSVPLVFHELLGLAQVEVGHYKVSSRIAPKAIDILERANASVGNLYFLTGPHLRRPIALYKSSIQLDEKGEIEKGVVARPSRLVVKFQILLAEGDRVTRNHESELEFSLDRGISNREEKIRQSESSAWVDVHSSSNKNFRLHRNLRLAGLTERTGWDGPTWRFEYPFGSVLGNPEHMSFLADGRPGTLSYDEQNTEKQGQLLLGNKTLRIWRISADDVKGVTAIQGVKDGTIILPVQGGSRLLRFQTDFFELNEAGEVTRGMLDNAKATIGGKTYHLGSETANFKNGQFSIPFLNHLIAEPLVAGVRVLTRGDADDAAHRFCVKYGYTLSMPYKTHKVVHFTGEQTFYDLVQDDFVTLASGSAEVLTSVNCSTVKIREYLPVSLIVQD